MLLDPDPDTCAAGRRYNLNRQIGHDIAGHDADVQKSAIDVLAKVSVGEVRDSGGKRIVPDEPGWCRWDLRPNVLKLLLANKQYDLISQMAAKALSDGRDEAGIDTAQAALVNVLLNTGKFDQALPAAKTYYNACKLENTSKASDLVVEALVNGPARTDPTIVARFKSEQAAGAQSAASSSDPSTPAISSQSVLKSIVVDPAPYQSQVDALANGKRDFDSLTRQGNLLLMQDKGADAVAIFQLTASMTDDPKQLSEAMTNVARAMRARDGGVASANAYIMSLQQTNKQ